MRTRTGFVTLAAAGLAVVILSGCRIPDMERFDPVSGTISGVGVKDRVSVVRDQNGIVHVSAENDEDLFFATGYAMAQDRFAMMDLLRRAGA